MKYKTKESNLNLIGFKRFLYRANPLVKIFVIGIVFIILGLMFAPLKTLIAVGGVIVLLYVIYFVTWLFLKHPFG